MFHKVMIVAVVVLGFIVWRGHGSTDSVGLGLAVGAIGLIVATFAEFTFGR